MRIVAGSYWVVRRGCVAYIKSAVGGGNYPISGVVYARVPAAANWARDGTFHKSRISDFDLIYALPDIVKVLRNGN